MTHRRTFRDKTTKEEVERGIVICQIPALATIAIETRGLDPDNVNLQLG